MNRSRIRALAKRVIFQFRRDHRTMGLLFVVPIIIVSLLALILRSSAGPTSLGVVNQDQGIIGGVGPGTVLVTALRANEKLSITDMSLEQANTALKEGRIKAAVVLPPEFSKTVLGERRLHFQLVLEGSNPSDTMSVMQALSQTAQKAIASLGAQGAPAIDIETRYLYGGPQFDAMDTFAPVYITFFVFFIVFLLTCVSFLRERMQGTLERLMATPVSSVEIVLGYTIGFGIFALIQSLVILLWTIYVLNVHYVGSLLNVFLVEAILTVVAVGMGIFLSIFARNELQAVQFIPIVIVPQAFLSGLIWPVKDMPGWLQPFSYIMPLTYATNALRDVMIKGFGLLEIAPNLIILLVIGIVTLALAAASLRREIA
jgi:ABC-2 type transport system permease protein